MFTYLALVSPPVALALDVFAPSVAETRRAVEVGPDVLQVLLEVPERERHGVDPMAPLAAAADLMRQAPRRQVGRRQLTAAETAAFPREEQRPDETRGGRLGYWGVAMSH